MRRLINLLKALLFTVHTNGKRHWLAVGFMKTPDGVIAYRAVFKRNKNDEIVGDVRKLLSTNSLESLCFYKSKDTLITERRQIEKLIASWDEAGKGER